MPEYFFVGEYRCELEGATVPQRYVAKRCTRGRGLRYAYIPVRMRETLTPYCHDGDAPQIAMALAGRKLCGACDGAEDEVVEEAPLTEDPSSYLVAVDCEHCGGDGWEQPEA